MSSKYWKICHLDLNLQLKYIGSGKFILMPVEWTKLFFYSFFKSDDCLHPTYWSAVPVENLCRIFSFVLVFTFDTVQKMPADTFATHVSQTTYSFIFSRKTEVLEPNSGSGDEGNHPRLKWPRLSEQLSTVYKWTLSGLQKVQSCPRRASVACDEPTDALGNSGHTKG